MHCTHCGTKLGDGAKFCKSCGKVVGSAHAETATVAAPSAATNNNAPEIKCGNCGYIGTPEKARNLFFTVLAWCCVVFAPLITVIYFVGTHKYKCPKCQSTFVGIKNNEGKFVGQRGGTGRTVKAVVLVLVGIAVMGILASIVLASLNSARQKALGNTSIEQSDGWQSYSSTADKFTVLFPEFPTYNSTTDTSGDNPYTLHEYKAAKGQSSFWVMKYDYTNGLDTSDPDHVLDVFLNAFVTSIGDGAKLTSSGYSYVGLNRSLNFQIDAGTEQMKGEFVLINDMPYLVAYDYYPSDYSDADYNKFINSFSAK